MTDDGTDRPSYRNGDELMRWSPTSGWVRSTYEPLPQSLAEANLMIDVVYVVDKREKQGTKADRKWRAVCAICPFESEWTADPDEAQQACDTHQCLAE